MSRKLRKMLGDAKAPCTLALMDLLSSQSKETIRRFTLCYAEANILPIFERHCPGDVRPAKALAAAHAYLNGELPFPAVKAVILKDCHAAARELADNPAAQAAARAVGQAASVVHALTHSLGIYFYGAAAVAYDRLGLEASKEAYAEAAEAVCLDITEALKKVAVADEQNPAVIQWHC